MSGLMALLRRAAALFSAGALSGAVVGTLIARSFIPWYQSPGDAMGGAQQLCNLPKVIGATISQVVHYQLIGAAIGAALVLVVGLLLIRAMGHRAAPASPS
jgi:hypothetical protein